MAKGANNAKRWFKVTVLAGGIALIIYASLRNGNWGTFLLGIIQLAAFVAEQKISRHISERLPEAKSAKALAGSRVLLEMILGCVLIIGFLLAWMKAFEQGGAWVWAAIFFAIGG